MKTLVGNAKYYSQQLYQYVSPHFFGIHKSLMHEKVCVKEKERKIERVSSVCACTCACICCISMHVCSETSLNLKTNGNYELTLAFTNQQFYLDTKRYLYHSAVILI